MAFGLYNSSIYCDIYEGIQFKRFTALANLRSLSRNSLADMRIQSEQGLCHRELLNELLDTGHRYAVHVLSHLPGGRSSGAFGLQVMPIKFSLCAAINANYIWPTLNAQIQSGRPAAGEASAD